MDTLKQIVYNCRKATLLIEKKQITSLSMSEKVELKIHLAGCSVCRLFQQQSLMINRVFRSRIPTEIKLDEHFKKELQVLIDDQLNKN